MKAATISYCARAPLAGFRRLYVTSSAIGLLACLLFTNMSPADSLLTVDVNARTNPTNMPAGYSPFALSGTGTQSGAIALVNGYTIALTAVNASGVAAGALDDRVRTTPTGSPSLYQLYQDFVFATTSVGLGGGMNLDISSPSLLPNTQYQISIYSFDSGSAPPPNPRTAVWRDGNDNNSVLFTTSFDGNALPTTNGQYKYSAIAKTDATGKLALRGRGTNATNANSVFLNGFEVAIPTELTLVVSSATGKMQIVNDQNVNFDVYYYEIRSAAGSLNLAGWTSLDDQEGLPLGSGWDKATNSTTNILSEVNLQSMKTFTTSGSGISADLGAAFTVGATQELKFYYAGPNDNALRQGVVRFIAGVAGDYNGNGVVDAADYVLWRKGGQLQNEAVTPGSATPQDYTVWRANFGVTLGSGTGVATNVTVPEPGALAMFGAVLICATQFGWYRRRRLRSSAPLNWRIPPKD